MTLKPIGWLLAAALAMPAPAQTPEAAPVHTRRSILFEGIPAETAAALADGGVTIEQDRAPQRALAEHRRLAAALAALAPQRPGVVDAYVVSVALDSDAVFSREARDGCSRGAGGRRGAVWCSPAPTGAARPRWRWGHRPRWRSRSPASRR